MLWFGATGVGDVGIDLDARIVTRDGENRHLEPQAFDVLAALLAHRDRVVPKTELIDAVWGDQFVSESALTTRIKEIRQALGDDGRTQGFVQNVRGRGYRFVAAEARPSTDGHFSSVGDVIGRSAALDELDALLDRSAVVTLIGPGGVGKTTLARAAAQRRRAAGGASIFVDLAAIAEPTAVTPALRQAAGLVRPPTDADHGVDQVAELHSLLVLDNCEHLLDEVSSLVARVLAFDGPVRILATSRERLGVPAERVQNVDPLSVEAARTLFAERAAHVQPTFQLDEANTDVVDEVVELVDRLPLAIEMAAGRMSALSLRDLIGYLETGADALSSANRNADGRHRSVASVVEWSEALLDETEQRVFTDFSVFAGTVALDDAVGVLSRPETDRRTIIDGLAGLVDKSLLKAELNDEPATYRMLATVRAQAARRRDDHCIRRHAEWFVDAAEIADADLRTVRELAGHHRLTSTMPELRATHQWARTHDLHLAARLTTATTHFAHSRLIGELAEWSGALFDRLADDHESRPAVAADLAADAAHRADYTTAARLASEAAESPDPRVAGSALETLSDIALYDGDLTGAERYARRLLAIGEAHGDRHLAVVGTCNLALSAAYGGQPDRGVVLVDDVSASPDLPPTGRAWLDYARGEALMTLDPAAAIGSYEQGLEIAEPAGSRFVVSVLRVSLAAAIARHGSPEQAARRFDAIVRAFQRDGNTTHAITTLRNVVHLLVRLEADDAAMTLLGALSGGLPKSTFGVEEEQLLASREAVATRASEADVDRWLAAGAGQDVGWCLGYALRALTAATP